MSANKETVRQLLDGVARCDGALIGSLLHDDAQWWVPQSAARHGAARPLVGREAVVGLLSRTGNFFRPGTTTWTVIDLIEQGSTVVAHVRRSCLTFAGQPYDNEYLQRFDFRDGRINTA
jgi:ketosteroid isomerase-like protein